MAHRVMIWDGSKGNDRAVVPILRALYEARGAEVTVVVVREARLGHCIGCFGCFVEKPGVCKIDDDAAPILRELVACDEVAFVGGVVFGGYSPTLKRMVDRILPILLPHFHRVRGEVHHLPRYQKRQRLLVVGVQEKPDEGEARIFRALAGRNAINFHALSHASEVLAATDSDDALRNQLRAALDRTDAVPMGPAVEALLPAAHPLGAPPTPPRRALLLVGSPKIGSSTSAVLGNHLLGRLEAQGVATSSLVLKGNLASAEAQSAVIDKAREADLLIVAFPLYVDSLHQRLTHVLEFLGARTAEWATGGPKHLVALCNSGFPEGFQNALALAICERFAVATGLHFAGGLALGGGEAVCGGVPLSGPERKQRPPAHKLIRALDRAGDAIAKGENLPADVNRLLDESPIPLFPRMAWRWIYGAMGEFGWNDLARQHGNKPKSLRARPLTTDAAE